MPDDDEEPADERSVDLSRPRIPAMHHEDDEDEADSDQMENEDVEEIFVRKFTDCFRLWSSMYSLVANRRRGYGNSGRPLTVQCNRTKNVGGHHLC